MLANAPDPDTPMSFLFVAVGRYRSRPRHPRGLFACRRWSLRSRPRHPRRLEF